MRRNLVWQYYIPYESFDKDMGGTKMPDWAMSGSRSASTYAKHCDADYMLTNKRYFPHLDPRLDSLRIIYDPYFEQFEEILSIDLDMLIHSKCPNIFNTPIDDVAMVHELGIFSGNAKNWLNNVMTPPQHKRGIHAYGKMLFGADWKFPKSYLYPMEEYRYMNGGVQLWSRDGRMKAREHFTSVDHYVLHTRYTEQMYINLQLSQPQFKVTELDTKWNRLSSYQWSRASGTPQPDGYINHFLARSKFHMPEFENTEYSIWQPT